MGSEPPQGSLGEAAEVLGPLSSQLWGLVLGPQVRGVCVAIPLSQCSGHRTMDHLTAVPEVRGMGGAVTSHPRPAHHSPASVPISAKWRGRPHLLPPRVVSRVKRGEDDENH